MEGGDRDLNAWAIEQAGLLRSGRFEALDVERIARRIEDIAQDVQRELARHLAALLGHLLRRKCGIEGPAWDRSIAARRRELARLLQESPSLVALLRDPAWLKSVWAQACLQAAAATGEDGFPASCPWRIEEEALRPGWFPR